MVDLQIPGTQIHSETSVDEDEVGLVSWTNETIVAETRMGWEGRYLVDRPRPVAYEGDNPIIDPSAMMDEHPYRVLAFGQEIWVVKTVDGTLTFYALSE